MKYTKRILSVVMAAILLLSLAACGAGAALNESAPSASYTSGAAVATKPGAPAEADGIYDAYYDKTEVVETPSTAANGSSVYQNSDVKLIRRASLTVQTTEFDQAVIRLDALVNQYFGYYENAEVYSGGYSGKNVNRSASYTIRVPAEHYDAFLGQMGDVGHLTRKTESTENVGEEYYDLEARLKTQRTKQERLLDLLKKADTMEDIIKIESALSDVEYQIERYSSSLKRYDGLIGYATITLNLNEVIKIVDEPTEKDPLFTRMVAGVVSSFDALVDTVENFLLWVSYNVFALVIFAAAVVVVVVVVRKRSLNRGGLLRRKNKRNQNPEETKEE